MIQEVKSFGADCDGCNESFINEHTGHSIFMCENSLCDDMDSCGWAVVENNCYCPKCYNFDDDGDVVVTYNTKIHESNN